MTDYMNPQHIYPDAPERIVDGNKTMANQCVCCGAEMPEGDQVCRRCRDEQDANGRGAAAVYLGQGGAVSLKTENLENFRPEGKSGREEEA